jgi:hypothetical protein
MNLLIELATALGAKLATFSAELNLGVVTVTSFPNGIYQVVVNGDNYTYNPVTGMRWFLTDVGDFAPDKYEEELRTRLLMGCVSLLKQGEPVALPAGIPLPVSAPMPAAPPVAPPAPQQVLSKVNRKRSGEPTHPDEPCRRCKGTGRKGPSDINNGLCYWCNGNRTQAYGFLNHEKS